MRDVVRESAVLIGAALAAGGILAAGLAGVVRGQLYGIGAHDPTTYTVLTFGLALVALAAVFVVARRAAGASPMDVLREE